MTEITALLTLLDGHWDDVMITAVAIVGFVIGRRLLRKVA